MFFSFFISCKKDKVITNSSAKLSFSQDSVLFDTVFTHIGSTTKLFRVHNRNNGKVNISSIRLARGDASFYRLNVDGVPGKSFSNIEIAAQDSMYIFVEVTIDPNNQLNPFIYRDSILFDLNGSEQHFDLIAFGQNAYYHMPNQKIIFSNSSALYYEVEPCSATWKNDKPHLIYGYAVVDSACTLTIQAGAKIYLHSSAGIWVYRYGSINVGVGGSPTNLVTFQGDRLEQEYKDVPGQWDRIWINEGSVNNIINYAVIKNGYIGVHAGYSAFDGVGNTVNVNDPKKLTLTNTIIQNCSYAGILGHFFNISGGNNVVVNCGQHLCRFEFGGSYSFFQSTFANYWNQTNNSQASNARTTPSFYFGDYENNTQLSKLTDSLFFGNCIMDGSMAEEFQFDTIAAAIPAFGLLKFDHCSFKTGSLQSNRPPTYSCEIITSSANQMIFNNPGTYDFKITNRTSAAYQWGSSSGEGIYTLDISQTPRSGTPDLGAYVIP